MMLTEGREAIFARQARAGEYVRGRAKSYGITSCLADHKERFKYGPHRIKLH